MMQNINNSAIVVINGVSYSKFYLEQLLQARIFEIHGFQYGGHEAQLFDISYEIVADNASTDDYRDRGCCYESSWQTVAEEAGLSVWEVAARYCNGQQFSVTKGRFRGSNTEESSAYWCLR